MEHHENMRPANSDEEVEDDSSLVCACSGEALLRTTQTIETSSSSVGEGPKEVVPWRLMVRLKEPSVSLSLEKEEPMSRAGV